jgi:hypothetical protein
MYRTDKIKTEQNQVSKSTRHPPLPIDEYAERVSDRLQSGIVTDEILAQLRTLVRHRDELCPAVRENLIIDLHFTAQRNSGHALQLALFATQFSGDFPQHLVLGQDGRATGQSHNRLSLPNAARIPAPVPVSTWICGPTANARISADADQTPEGIRQTQAGIS